MTDTSPCDWTDGIRGSFKENRNKYTIGYSHKEYTIVYKAADNRLLSVVIYI